MQHFFHTANDYNSEATAYLYATLNNLLLEKSIVNIALSGGSTPLSIYKMLFEKNVDWKRVNMFLVDERCIAPENSNSNFGNILRLTKKKINLYQMYFPSLGNERSAEKYQQLLQHTLPNEIFDLILLGIGEDGHTASLFPNSSALSEAEKSVVHNKVQNEFENRITLTYPILLNAEKIVVLAKGEKKKKVICDLSNKTANYPIAKIVNEAHNLQWILD